eukprot:812260-Pleurochrysis_carterae.AAC.1
MCCYSERLSDDDAHPLSLSSATCQLKAFPCLLLYPIPTPSLFSIDLRLIFVSQPHPSPLASSAAISSTRCVAMRWRTRCSARASSATPASRLDLCAHRAALRWATARSPPAPMVSHMHPTAPTRPASTASLARPRTRRASI